MVITLELEGGERIQLVQQGVGVDNEIFAEFEKQTDDLTKDLEESSTYFTRFRLLIVHLAQYPRQHPPYFLFPRLEELLKDFGVEVQRQEDALEKVEDSVNETAEMTDLTVYELYQVISNSSALFVNFAHSRNN